MDADSYVSMWHRSGLYRVYASGTVERNSNGHMVAHGLSPREALWVRAHGLALLWTLSDAFGRRPGVDSYDIS